MLFVYKTAILGPFRKFAGFVFHALFTSELGGEAEENWPDCCELTGRLRCLGKLPFTVVVSRKETHKIEGLQGRKTI